MIVSVALSGCTGVITGDSPDPKQGSGTPALDAPLDPSDDPIKSVDLPECATRGVPLSPLRRLSSTQYQNTIQQLFGADLAAPLIAGSLFPQTQVNSGFSGDAEANVVNTAESNAIEDNAQHIADVVLADPAPYLARLMPCTVSAPTADAEIDACVDSFITSFGQQAYRRPITANEAALARRVYDEVRVDESAVIAWASVLQYFVQAPALLYRVERGAGLALPGLVRLTDYEMATRLSYFLLDSMPDDQLLSAASEGRLSKPADILTEAERLMQTDAFVSTASAFHREWLELYDLPAAKDPTAYPNYTSEVHDALAEETEQFVRYILAQPDANVATLLGSSTGVVNSTLADYLGVSAPGATATDWVPVEMPHRRGLLTSAPLMATLAKDNRSHPIHRGGFVRTQILCQVLPALPGNVDIQGPLQDTSTLPTARERLAPLLTRTDCSGCHSQINPIGLGFENYDGAGVYRDTENGAPIDASGTIQLDGVEQPFTNGTELADALANSAQVRDCYGLWWYRAAQGRGEFTEDSCSVAYVKNAAEESNGDVRAIVRAVIQTDGFLYRQEVQQ